MWQSDGHPDWRVDVLAVEDSIRRACKTFRVAELAFDPFRWSRSGQVLAGEGLRTAEFPFSPSRITRATTDLVTALASGGLSHVPHPTLSEHVLATSIVEDHAHGALRIGKTTRRRTKALKVDCAAALLICHSRCTWLASKPTKKRRTVAF